MIQILRQWYDRHFTNPQVVILALLLMILRVALGLVVITGGLKLAFPGDPSLRRRATRCWGRCSPI